MYRGSKGVAHSIILRKEQYIRSLYENESGSAGVKSLQFNKQANAMLVQTVTKKLLNNVYTKMKVHDNKVTCTPFDKSA